MKMSNSPAKYEVLCGLENAPSTANGPQFGPQMIPRPAMIPANGVAKIENGVDSMNSLWTYILNCAK